jgi:hypothetical protein
MLFFGFVLSANDRDAATAWIEISTIVLFVDSATAQQPGRRFFAACPAFYRASQNFIN